VVNFQNGLNTVNSLNQSLETSTLPKTRLFGTDGIRGKAGELLNANFALQLGLAAGEVWQQVKGDRGPIILGQDSRNSSDMLATALTAGLTSAGLEVWNLGLCPTPCVASITSSTEATGGIMISASHNPPEDNGIKFFTNNGTKLDGELTEQIEERLRANYGSQIHHRGGIWGKQYYRPGLVGNYVNALKRSIDKGMNFQGIKIVLDLAWGAAIDLAPEIFRQLGAEVVALHDRADGDRINVNCGSTHLDALKTAVKQTGADLGFAFDGDADRTLAVDSNGRVVDGDYILYFWGEQLQKESLLPDNLIVATVMANLGFERAWQKRGGKLTRTAVGDRYVQAEMWRTGAMLGGEQSGHILCHHHGVSGDGIQTALHLTSLVRQSGLTLSQLVDNSFQTYPQILRNVRVEDRERRSHWQECEPLQKAIAKAEAAMGELGRILVRPSGTEPLIRVMVEAESTELVNHWTEELVRTVEEHLAS
jgi:phosphoglucosamine mutase